MMIERDLEILLLEDSPIDAELVQRELERGGIRFHATRAATEAEFRAGLGSETEIDVILADYSLPGFSGMEALAIACELARETPFIFVSGSLGEERAIEALRQGATDYVLKDRISRLPSAVQRAVGHREQRRLRRDAQQQLGISQERFHLAARATRDVIWDLRLDTGGMWVNEALRTEWGWDDAEVTPEWWNGRIHPDDVAQVVSDKEAALTGHAITRLDLQYRFQRPDGRYGHVLDRSFIVRDRDQHPVRMVGAVQDITASVEAERRLEQERRISSLGRVAAVIAHEFNNVLMGIQPFAEVVRMSRDARMVNAAERILSAVGRGRQITQNILRASSTGEPALEIVDMPALVRDITAEVRGMLPPDVGLVVDVDVAAGPVRCDPRQIQQVALNLTANARDAMGSSPGELRIALKRIDGVAAIIVSDTGPGIPAETLPHIFEPLFTTKKTGTGLGLAIAQQLVVRNGGTIEVSSTFGAGATFTICLPIAERERERTEVPGGAAWPEGIRRLLLVEDDEVVAAGMVILLEQQGVEVRTAGLAAEVEKTYVDLRPDAVVLDLTLPDGNGMDVYHMLAARDPQLPVIIGSGHVDASLVRGIDARAPVGFLQKPYDLKSLIATLHELLGRSRGSVENTRR